MHLYSYQAPEGGTGSAPAAAPASAPAATPATPASGSSPDVQWDLLADDGDESESPEPLTAPQKPAAAPASNAPAPAAPAAPATAAQPTAPAQPAQQPAAQPTPEQQAEQAKQAREAIATELEGMYTSEITEDMKAQLLAEPHAVIPKLMTKAAMDGAQMAYRQILMVLPQIFQHQAGQREGMTKAWGDFNSAHADLSKPEYRQAVTAAVNMVRASGQKYATKEEAMAAVARVARATLNLPAQGAAEPAAPAAPVVPHTPVARGNSAPAAPKKAAAPGAQGINWGDFLD